MLGMIDRATKNAHVFCILDNRDKETLLPIIVKSINTMDDIQVNG